MTSEKQLDIEKWNQGEISYSSEEVLQGGSENTSEMGMSIMGRRKRSLQD